MVCNFTMTTATSPEDDREGGDIYGADMVMPTEGTTAIQEFYTGSKILVTGGTGFMGQLLLEKLLRSCPGIEKIYVLIRSKKGKDIGTRFEEIFKNVIFQTIHHDCKSVLQKVVPVTGDCAEPGLGLSEKDSAMLVREVDLIFHCAATVRFDEKLKLAVHINIRGTRDLLVLAKEMKNLRSFVHISTAYSNCPLPEIDEKFYKAPISGEKLINVVDSLDEKILDTLTPALIGEWPNTYAFTKMVAEETIRTYGKGLPVSVVRPSIVIATAKEPLPGWINNMYGATGVIIGSAIGLLRTLQCKPDNIADLVPADYAINATIAAAWDNGKSKSSNSEISQQANSFEDGIPIFNYTSSSQRPITWYQFMKMSEKAGEDIPPAISVWCYFLILTKYRWLHLFYSFFLHFVPAVIVDACAMLIGRKPVLVKAYRKIGKFSDVIAYFATRQWKFYNNNTQALFQRMDPEDKKIFDFDMSALRWEDYFYTYIRGLRVYLINDPLDTIPVGKRKKTIYITLHYTILALIFYGLFKLLMFILL